MSSVLRDFCRSFATIDADTDYVRIIHETASFFLMTSSEAGDLFVDALPAQMSIAETCLGSASDALSSFPDPRRVDNDGKDTDRPAKELYDALTIDTAFLEYGAIA